jgi:Lrp/AsnC family transcriptional regulator, leucine-responsive regulatory protein
MALAGNRFVKLDRTDLKILEALQADGRISNLNLAKSVGLSPSACLSRVRGLESRGIITGYRAKVDVELVRPTMMVYAEITMKQHDLEAFSRFEAFIRGLPEVLEAYRVSGAIDYMVKVMVTDSRGWRDLAVHLLDEYNIDKVTTHIILVSSKEPSVEPLVSGQF